MCKSTEKILATRAVPHIGATSPDSKLKALLRAKAERSVDALWNTVGDIVKLFEPQECANYFAAAGYDPD
jgi:hypothetical protein